MVAARTTKPLTYGRLLEVISYHPESGKFYWNVTLSNIATAGSEAGHIDRDSYRKIRIDGLAYTAGHLAWLWMTGNWPTGDIDHKNRSRHDNRWSNLRVGTRSQNIHNAGLRKTNKSGFRGVSWSKEAGKWYASIKVMGKGKNLGFYDTAEAAHQAYMIAANKFFDSFACDGKPVVAAISR